VRAYRKRTWASFTVNMTPLIDVVFLIIIFFIMIMNVTEALSGKVTLPEADEAKKSKDEDNLAVTIKSETLFYVGNIRVSLDNMDKLLKLQFPKPKGYTIQLRGDENIPYNTVQQVMQKIAAAGITNINLAIRKTQSTVERDLNNEASPEIDR